MYTAGMNQTIITKRIAVDIFGTQAELARSLGLKSRQNVSRWEWCDPVPEWAYLKIRYVLKPELFNDDHSMIEETA
jgi:hypothetical protein